LFDTRSRFKHTKPIWHAVLAALALQSSLALAQSDSAEPSVAPSHHHAMNLRASQPKPHPKAKPHPKSHPKAKPHPKPHPKAKAKPHPKPRPKVKAAPKPKPHLKPKPQRKSLPKVPQPRAR